MQHPLIRSARVAALTAYRDASTEPSCLRDDLRAARAKRIAQAQQRIARGKLNSKHGSN